MPKKTLKPVKPETAPIIPSFSVHSILYLYPYIYIYIFMYMYMYDKDIHIHDYPKNLNLMLRFRVSGFRAFLGVYGFMGDRKQPLLGGLDS